MLMLIAINVYARATEKKHRGKKIKIQAIIGKTRKNNNITKQECKQGREKETDSFIYF